MAEDKGKQGKQEKGKGDKPGGGAAGGDKKMIAIQLQMTPQMMMQQLLDSQVRLAVLEDLVLRGYPRVTPEDLQKMFIKAYEQFAKKLLEESKKPIIHPAGGPIPPPPGQRGGGQ